MNNNERQETDSERPAIGMPRVLRATGLAMGRNPRVGSVTEQRIDGPIALRIYKPDETTQPRPAFMWFFGGGFIIGDLDTADSICRSIALAANCIVIAVRYSLAPEHNLSAGRADALAALQWMAKQGAGVVTERWGLALLRLLSPTALSACRLLIRPWFLPTVMMRRKAISGLDRLAARQTWPTEKTCTVNP